MRDDDIYRAIADELAAGQTDAAVWTRAFAEAEGNAEKTKAIYIKQRFVTLRSQEAAPAPATPTAAHDDPGLRQLRTDLTQRLALTGKSSFYKFFGVSPTVEQVILEQAIGRYEADIASGRQNETPEFRYAREALGSPQARIQYDRRLLEQLRPGDTRSAARTVPDFDVDATAGGWWNTRKAAVLVGTLAVVAVGYLSLGFFKEKGHQEVAKEVVSTHKDVAHSAAEIERARVENERIAVESRVNVDNTTNEQRLRAVAIEERAEDRRRMESEARLNAERERLELARKEQEKQAIRQEDLKAAKEQRYWACMKVQVTQMRSTAAEAYCAQYRM